MKEFILKYNLLDSFSKKEIDDFLKDPLNKKSGHFIAMLVACNRKR